MNPQEVADKLKELTGLNIFKNTRRREYVEIRAVFFHILRHKHRLTLRGIQDIFEQNGKKINHATIVHSLKEYDVYCRANKDLDKINDMFPIKSMPKVEIKTAVQQISIIRKLHKEIDNLTYQLKRKSNDVTPLHKLVSKIPKERQSEAKERIELMIKGWDWKYEDKCEIIGGFNSVEAY